MKYSLSSPRILALVALVFASTPGSVMAGAITVDGVNDSNDAYTNSFIANWTNEHHNHAPDPGSVFTSGTDETTVWWESYGTSYYLFIEAPLEAKNMIWGSGVSATELALYDVHNTHIEPGGSTPHHGPLSGIDHGKATGSEKAIFEGITAKLKDDSVSGATGLVDNATSHSFLDNSGICNDSACAATTTTASFEFEFNLSTSDFSALLSGIATNGIEFHLSPERGGTTSVPEPTTLALLGAGLLGLFMRRKRVA